MKNKQKIDEVSAADRPGDDEPAFSAWARILTELGKDLSPELAARLESPAEECARYRELFDNARDAIYTHDLKGRYLSANKAAEELVGFSCEEIVGRSIADFIPAEYLGEIRGRRCACSSCRGIRTTRLSATGSWTRT